MAETGTPDSLPAGLCAALLAEPSDTLLGLASRWLLIDTERACRIAAVAITQQLTDLEPGRRLESTHAGGIAAEFRDWLHGRSTSTVEDIALRIFTLDWASHITEPGEHQQALKHAKWLYEWFTGGRPRRPRGAP